MTDSETLQQRCNLLADTPFFEQFDSEELTSLLQCCDSKVLAAREALWAVDTPGDSAYILLEGRLEKITRLPPDYRRVDQIDDAGAVLGLSYLVKDWPHQSATTALERTELLQLKRPTFRRMFDDGEIAAYRLVDKIAEKLVLEMRDANDRLHEVFGNPAETLRMLRRRVRST